MTNLAAAPVALLSTLPVLREMCSCGLAHVEIAVEKHGMACAGCARVIRDERLAVFASTFTAVLGEVAMVLDKATFPAVGGLDRIIGRVVMAAPASDVRNEAVADLRDRLATRLLGRWSRDRFETTATLRGASYEQAWVAVDAEMRFAR